MKNYRLTETKIGSAAVVVEILPKGKVIPNTAMTPTSITIHNTGNIGAPAKNNHNYMKNCNKDGSRVASWHFTVDDKYIYQAVPTNRKAWHAGCASGNNTSIGIEICMFNDAARQKKCYENAIALVKILMKYHGFTTSNIKRHYDWTKKDCPTWLISGKFGYNWTWFKNQCAGKASTTPTTPAPAPSNPTVKVPYTAKILVDDLNVRKGPGASYEVSTVVKKGQSFTIIEEKDGWGKLKSGAGWINVSTKYVTKIAITPAFSPYVVKVLVDTLNVRTGPGTSNPVATTVKKGQSFTIIEEKDGWGKLKSGAGWISLDKAYVQKI